MFVYADAISIRILDVRALLAARGTLIERRRVMEVPSIPQGHSLLLMPYRKPKYERSVLGIRSGQGPAGDCGFRNRKTFNER